jgi:hypothetical protein
LAALSARLSPHAARIFAALLTAGGIPLCLLDTPMWWLGGAMLVSAASLVGGELLERAGSLARGPLARLGAPRRVLGREVSARDALLELLAVAAVAFVAVVMMRDLLGGERPVGRDHTIHFAKAWLLHTDLLPKGHIYGWTHDWFAGYPANYLYPPGGDLWVNATHALSFGALSFSQAYAFAFLLFHVLTGVSAYVLARTVCGRTVSVIAAVLCVTDPGYFRMGGWRYTVESGVWPQALALNFSLLGLACLPGIVQTRRLAPIGAFGLWMGLSFICHPIELIFVALAVLVAAVSAIVADGVRAATAVFRLLLGVALGLWVGMLWLIPFFSARGETNQMGVWWDTTYEMAKRLLDAQLFPGTLPYVFAFGLMGVVLMLRARSFMLLFISLMAITVPAITNSTVLDELHAANVLGPLSKVQYLRLSTMVKPFWFVLAAYAVAAAFQHARIVAAQRITVDAPVAKVSRVRRAVLAGVIALLTLPVLLPLCEAFTSRFVLTTIMTESDRVDRKDRARLEQWLLKNLPRDHFYRLGIFTGDQHDFMDLDAVLDRPLYKRGFTPASNFVYQPHDRHPSLVEASNVRFAISRHPLPDQQFEKLTSFGQWMVYRFLPYRPEPFRILQGQGDIKLEKFSDEEIVLRAAPGARGKLRVNVSYFSRWKAYRDGQRIPITISFLRDAPADTGYMTVPLAPGQYRFVFERTLGDKLAVPIGLFGMLACGLVLVADRREGFLRWLKRMLEAASRRFDRMSEPGFAFARRTLLALVLAGGAVAFVALATWKPPIEIEEMPNLDITKVRFDFIERISTATAGIAYRDAYRPCMRQGDRLVCRNAQGELDVDNYVGNTPATLKEYVLVRCLRARPVDDGTLYIQYPSVPVGEALVGYYGVERAGRLMTKRRPVSFSVSVGGQELYSGMTQNDNRMHAFRIPMREKVGDKKRTNVTFSVHAENVSRRFFCFHAQVVELE